MNTPSKEAIAAAEAYKDYFNCTVKVEQLAPVIQSAIKEARDEEDLNLRYHHDPRFQKFVDDVAEQKIKFKTESRAAQPQDSGALYRLAAQIQQLIQDQNRCVKGNWVTPEAEEIIAILETDSRAAQPQDYSTEPLRPGTPFPRNRETEEYLTESRAAQPQEWRIIENFDNDYSIMCGGNFLCDTTTRDGAERIVAAHNATLVAASAHSCDETIRANSWAMSGERNTGDIWKCSCGKRYVHICDEAEACFWARANAENGTLVQMPKSEKVPRLPEGEE
jgi:hypothetical protein